MTAEPPKHLRIMRNTHTQPHAQIQIMAPTRRDSANALKTPLRYFRQARRHNVE